MKMSETIKKKKEKQNEDLFNLAKKTVTAQRP